MILALILFFQMPAHCIASEPEATEKAITEVSKSDGFKLSAKAIQTLGVKLSSIIKPSEISLPKDAVVYSLDKIAVYRVRSGWFKLIPIKIIREQGEQVLVYSSEITTNDQIAIKGVALIRVSEMEAFGGAE